MAIDIQQSLEKTWQHIVPSIAETLILLIITVFLFGTSHIYTWLEYSVTKSSLLTNPEFIKILETYGITKIMPLAVLFIALMFCYASSRLAHSIGNLLPGRFSRNDTLALLKPELRYAITSVLLYYPHFAEYKDFNFIPSLSQMLDERVTMAELEGKPSFYSQAVINRKLAWRQASRLDFLKFAALWAAIVGCLSILSGIDGQTIALRENLVFIILLMTSIILIRNQAKYYRQYAISKVYAIKAELVSEHTVVKAPDMSKRAEVEGRIHKVLDEQLSATEKNPLGSSTWTFQLGGFVIYPWSLWGIDPTGKPTYLSHIVTRLNRRRRN